ncbi:DedA family protein [Lacisediminihabitans changchengi]|uniref:DedA family protein n=1 Tax=Lacisediminihabitans changchengi TaxID=2787634 RepID=A0A934SJ75_9MICO|nr:DedA family protein [Lacisediminihabitans changchengi]MBK4346573.1 DedA family protein [Lacisediminihabitans changchengi]
MNEVLTWILDTVRHVEPLVRLLILLVGMFCETSILVGLVVPGDTIVLVSSTAIDGWPQYLGTLAAVIVGSLAGESVGFALGRWFGPHLRASWVGRRIGAKNWNRAENYLARRGGIAVFISRFLPVLHALIPLTVGTSPMTYRRFMRWTAPACIVWALAYVSVGWLAAGSYRRLADQLHGAGFLFAGIIVVFLVAVLVIKKVVEKREAQHMGAVERDAVTGLDDDRNDHRNDNGAR